MELFSEQIIPTRTWAETVLSSENTLVNPRIIGGSSSGAGYGFNTLGNGDCEIGDYDNNNGMLWDNSARTLSVKGDIVVTGDITSSNYSGTAPYAGYKLEYSTGNGYFNQIKIRGGSNSYFISDTIDTQAKSILKDFSFSDTDYSGAFKTGDITWNTTTGAITGGSGGLFNKGGLVFAHNGTPTITLNGTTGEATFSGNVTGATITGGTVQTSSGTGQRIKLEGTNNTLTFYNSSNEVVSQIGGGTSVANALRVTLDSDTTVGAKVVSAHANDIGFRFDCSGNYDSVGFYAGLVGASNTGTGLYIDHDGSGGEGIYLDITNGADGIYIGNSGGGDSLQITTSSGKSIYITHSSDSHRGIELDYTGRKEALYIQGGDSNTSKPVVYFSGNAADKSSDCPITLFERDVPGFVSIIKSTTNSSDRIFGLGFNLVNSGSGLEYAFNFAGSEYDSSKTSVSGLTGVVRVYTSEGTGYIPIYSSAS